MKRQFTIFYGIIGLVMVFFILKYFTQTEENKNYLTFDGNLEHSMSISGILSEIMPRFNSIYFIETSGRMQLTLRQLCVIESAAKYHPNNSVYVLMTSPKMQDRNFEVIQKDYKNLFAKYIHIPSLIQDSPLEQLWKQNDIQNSKYYISHLSDVLRFLVLHQFGGTYLDLDALIVNPLPDIPNFIGRESVDREFLAAGVLKSFFHCENILFIIFTVVFSIILKTIIYQRYLKRFS